MMCLLLFKINCNARQNKSVIFDLEHSAIDLELQMLTRERQARQKGPAIQKLQVQSPLPMSKSSAALRR